MNSRSNRKSQVERLDLRLLQQNVIKFVHDPESRSELVEEENSVMFNVIACICLLPISFFLILTIIGAPIGYPMAKGIIWGFMTGEIFEDPAKTLQKNSSRMRPFVAAPIIIGPTNHGLILMSGSPKSSVRPDYLAKKAEELGEVYKSGTTRNGSDPQLVSLLRDDQYVPNRRRQLPPAYSDGEKLFLLDVEIQLNRIHTNAAGLPLLLCVWLADKHQVEGKMSGRAIQLPWRIAQASMVRRQTG